jgi:hypothetical protein
VGVIDLAHAAFADQGANFIGSEADTNRNRRSGAGRDFRPVTFGLQISNVRFTVKHVNVPGP